MAKKVFDGDALRRARHIAGMSQQQLAEAAKCCRNTVSRAENGECSPRMARVLGRALQADSATFYREANADGAIGRITQQQHEVLDAMTHLGSAGSWAIWSFAMDLLTGGSVENAASAAKLGQVLAARKRPPKS